MVYDRFCERKVIWINMCIGWKLCDGYITVIHVVHSWQQYFTSGPLFHYTLDTLPCYTRSYKRPLTGDQKKPWFQMTTILPLITLIFMQFEEEWVGWLAFGSNNLIHCTLTLYHFKSNMWIVASYYLIVFTRRALYPLRRKLSKWKQILTKSV